MDINIFNQESKVIVQNINDNLATNPKSSKRPISYEEIMSKMVFWPEYFTLMMKFKYNPYGSTSLDIPEFHKRNINNIVSESSVADYQYNLMNGRTDARESIVKHFPEIKRFQEAGHKITPEHIFLSSGAVAGISHSIGAICQDTEDEVIILEPMYPFHLTQVIQRKIILKSVRMNFDPQANDFKIDFEGLRKALTPKSKVLVLCNPNNPTAKVYTPEEYKKISELIKDFPDLYVIEDMAYFLYYDEKYQPVPYAVVNPQDFNRTLSVYSGGKMYNVTGLRCGIIVGAPEFLGKLILHTVLDSGLGPCFEQSVIRDDVISANEPYGNEKDFYEETRKDVVKRGKRIAEELTKLGLTCPAFEGSYYLVAYLEPLRGKIDKKYYKKLDDKEQETPELDKAFCRMLALEKEVGLMPMSQLYFGENIPDNLVRIAVNRNDNDIDYFINACKDLIKL